MMHLFWNRGGRSLEVASMRRFRRKWLRCWMTTNSVVVGGLEYRSANLTKVVTQDKTTRISRVLGDDLRRGELKLHCSFAMAFWLAPSCSADLGAGRYNHAVSTSKAAIAQAARSSRMILSKAMLVSLPGR